MLKTQHAGIEQHQWHDSICMRLSHKNAPIPFAIQGMGNDLIPVHCINICQLPQAEIFSASVDSGCQRQESPAFRVGMMHQHRLICIRASWPCRSDFLALINLMTPTETPGSQCSNASQANGNVLSHVRCWTLTTDIAKRLDSTTKEMPCFCTCDLDNRNQGHDWHHCDHGS